MVSNRQKRLSQYVRYLKSICFDNRLSTIGYRQSNGRSLGGMCALAVCLASGMAARGAPRNVVLSRTTAAGVPVMVITVDMNDPNVKVTGMVAAHGSGSSERFDSMVRRTHPTAAVTGTFFSVGSLAPIGDIVVDGQLAHRGGVGTGLCITDDNECEFVKPPHRYDWMDWSRYDFVCCSGPRLVCRGHVGVYPHDEGFRDRHLLGRATRLAVGRTASNKLRFVATRSPILLSRMARTMRSLGCVDAITLDAGSSLGFYYGGKMLVPAHRKLTNLILIYDDRSRYTRFKSRLTPPRQQALASRRQSAPRTDASATAYPAVKQESGTWWVR